MLHHLLLLVLLAFSLASCQSCNHPTRASDAAVVVAEAGQPTRLRVVNGCSQALWIFWQPGAGGGTMAAPNQLQLQPGGHYDYPIPDQGLAGTRFWPGYNCGAGGTNCQLGSSGGPSSLGFTCPPWGCAPPLDSKFEGTFGCLPSVPTSQCQNNPSASPPAPLPQTDGWDTSLVDGFTLPYRVRVLGSCPTGPQGGVIDCSSLPLSSCPTAENLSSGGQFPTLGAVNMGLYTPQDAGHLVAGCYSDCARLTMNQWGGMSYSPSSPQALEYCCPTPPVTPSQCHGYPVADSGYTQLVHRTCPQVYAYAYDDGTGNWSCPAGVQYEVTFYCPQ